MKNGFDGLKSRNTWTGSDIDRSLDTAIQSQVKWQGLDDANPERKLRSVPRIRATTGHQRPPRTGGGSTRFRRTIASPRRGHYLNQPILSGRESKTREELFAAQWRKVLKNLLVSHPRGHVAQHVVRRDPGSLQTRASPSSMRIDLEERSIFQVHHGKLPAESAGVKPVAHIGQGEPSPLWGPGGKTPRFARGSLWCIRRPLPPTDADACSMVKSAWLLRLWFRSCNEEITAAASPAPAASGCPGCWAGAGR